MSGSIKSILALVVSAVVTVVAADVLLGRIVVFPPLEYETSDAIHDYERANPDILVLGSSYARSFLPFASWLSEQKPGLVMQVVPIEGGRFSAYDWLLRNRLADLTDELGPQGQRVRPKLKHFILVTNPWDVCGNDDPYPNLPARAWALGDYAKDLFLNGVTTYNNNYIDQIVNEHMSHSTLLRDRGHSRITHEVGDLLRSKSPEERARVESERLRLWTVMLEQYTDLHASDNLCRTKDELAALQGILGFAKEHQLAVTLVLWPTYPSALSPALVASGQRFRTMMEGYASMYGAKVVNLQDTPLLEDADFRRDFDHLQAQGDEKVKQWAIEGPFRSLAVLAGGKP